jgi:hypothetical protein
VARPVSQAFKDVWQKKQGGRDFRKVSYKRRYWNGSAFVYEANWTDLDDSKIIGVGPIPMQLDTPRANVYRTSQISVRLDNTNNEWIQGTAPPSIFAADAIATLGYRLYKTQVQVQFGYLKQDGTKEYTALFTGLIVRSRPTSKDDEVVLEVTSRGLLLENADAEKVSFTFTLENCIPATGDGSNKVFETTSVGVDHLTDVQVNASSLTQGTDWRVDNLNQVVEPGVTGRARITFTTAPTAGHTVKASGLRWKTNQAIESLVADLCEEAGIISSERTIVPVTFPGGVSGSKTIDTEAQWEAAGAAKTNISTDAFPGSIIRKWFLQDNFTDGDYTLDPTWTVHVNTGGTVSVSSGKFTVTHPSTANGNILVSVPWRVAKNTGSWRFKVDKFGLDQLNPSSVGNDVRWYFFLDSNAFSGNFPTGNGYALKVLGGGGGLGVPIQLVKYTVSGTVETVLASSTAFTSVGDIRVTRDASGNFNVYDDGSLIMTATDTTHSTNTHMMLCVNQVNASTGVSSGFIIDEIHWTQELDGSAVAASDAAAVYESEEFDLLAAPTSWGILERTHVLNSGTITYSTAVASISGGPYDAYVAVGGAGEILSALKRYLKIKVEITPASGSWTSPETQKLVANFQNTQVFVALANFSGQNCFDAIEVYAQISNYEMGLDGDGKFFFRPKDVTPSPILEINQENAIISVNEADQGFEDIINVGRVRYNGYFNEYDGADAGEASPTSEQEYGRIVQDEAYELLLANDVNIGRGRAQAIYEAGFRPKRKLRISTWIIPWLELSDVITVSVFDHPLLKQTIAGDPLQAGFAYFMAGEAQNVLARDLDMKVVEYKPNLDANQAEMLLEEVLS